VSSRQRDLFLDDEQADLFGEDSPIPVYRTDPDKVRQELHKILAEARAAQPMPWDAKRALLYRTIFPQMTNWLSEEEGTQLRFEFEAELLTARSGGVAISRREQVRSVAASMGQLKFGSLDRQIV
jgi:hypothetical protein